MRIVPVLKIEPCNKCGETPKINENILQYSKNKGMRFYACYCDKCNIRAVGNTREDAVIKWNEMQNKEK